MNNKFKFTDDAINTLVAIFEALNIEDPKVHAHSQIEAIGVRTILKLIAELDIDQQNELRNLINAKDKNFLIKFYEKFDDKKIQEAFISEFKNFITNFFSESGGNFNEQQLKKVDEILADFYSSLK